MSHRFTLPSLLMLAIAAVAPSSRATAQGLPFSVSVHDSVRVLHPGEVIDMKATITNQSFGPITVRAVRYLNDLPDSTWYSAMCFGDLCYPPDMDVSPGARIDPGESVEFKLTIGTEHLTFDNDTLFVGIRFDAGDLTDYLEQVFTVVADGTASAPAESARDRVEAFPNPAATVATLPLGGLTAGRGAVDVQIVDALGRVVSRVEGAPAGADGVRVDVSELKDGAYFFRLENDGDVRVGRVVVAHR
jgi:hypothetical protein